MYLFPRTWLLVFGSTRALMPPRGIEISIMAIWEVLACTNQVAVRINWESTGTHGKVLCKALHKKFAWIPSQ